MTLAQTPLWVQFLGSALLLCGAGFVLITAVAVLRTGDAVARVNALSPATGLGLPLLFVGAFVLDTAVHGWSWLSLGKVVLAVVASLVVSSVGSNILGRAAYRSAESLDPLLTDNALGEPTVLPAPEDQPARPWRTPS